MNKMVWLMMSVPLYFFSCGTTSAAEIPAASQNPAVTASSAAEAAGSQPYLSAVPLAGNPPVKDPLVLRPYWRKGDQAAYNVTTNFTVSDGKNVWVDAQRVEIESLLITNLLERGFHAEWMDADIQQVKGAKNPLEEKIGNVLENTKVLLTLSEKGGVSDLNNYPELKNKAQDNLRTLSAIIGTNARVKNLMDDFLSHFNSKDTAFSLVAQPAQVLLALYGEDLSSTGPLAYRNLMPSVHTGSLKAQSTSVEVKSYNRTTGEAVLTMTQVLDSREALDWLYKNLRDLASANGQSLPSREALAKDFSYADEGTYSINFKTGRVSQVKLERRLQAGTYLQKEQFQMDGLGR